MKLENMMSEQELLDYKWELKSGYLAHLLSCRLEGREVDYKELADATFGKECTFENSSKALPE